MGLETANFIQDLNPSWPLGSDPRGQGDDHDRLLKTVLRNTFPTANRAFNLQGWSEKSPLVLPKSASYLVDVTDDGKTLRFTGGSPRTVSLPTAASAKNGFGFFLYNAVDWPLTIDPAGSELIEGQPTLILGYGEGGFVSCDGSGWAVTGSHELNVGVGNFIPTIFDYGRPGMPLCDGSGFNPSQYPRLASILGGTLPDLRGRVLAGRDRGVARLNHVIPDVVGGVGGEQKHQLSQAELPSFSFTVARIQLGGFFISGASAVNISEVPLSFGGDVPHNNVQPTYVANWLIKA